MKKIYLFILPVFLLAGLSPAQTFSWVNTAGNNTFVDYGLGVTVDNNHNVIVTGMHFDTGMFGSTSVSGFGYQDAFVAKYDSAGTLLWVRGIGGGEQDWGYAVTTDASDNIYVTGTYAWYSLHFTPTDSLPISAAQATNCFVAKYDASGNFLWARSGGASYSKSSAVAVDPSGDVIISGFYNGSINFSSNILTGGGSNLFFVKYSPAGNVVWAKSGTSSSMCGTNAMKCDANGNIYATGKISQNITFGATTYPRQGGDDMYTAKFNSSGDVQWFQLEGKTLAASTTSNNLDCGNGIDVDNSGNVYVAGSLIDTFISASMFQSAAIVKYNNAGARQWVYKFGNNNGIDVFNGLSLDAAGNPYVIGTYRGGLTIGTSVLPTASDDDIMIAKFNSSGSCIGTIGIGTGNGGDAGNGIMVDPNGSSIYLAGSMRQTLNFGTVTAVGDFASTIFVAKMTGNAINSIGESTASIGYVLYPNPSDGMVNLQFENAGEYLIEVYNSTGQLVLTNKTQTLFAQIDLSDLEAGIYFISIADADGNKTTGKILKQ
jgi:hypothetical protein